MSATYPSYPVGTKGVAWGASEREQWRSQRWKNRDYFTDVVSPLLRLSAISANVFQYGEVDYRCYGAARYPLLAVKSVPWVETDRMVVISGGVHGYETSGVLAALRFAQHQLAAYSGKGVNILIIPCVSPWGYEYVQRWTPEALDPNRCFIRENPGCPEAAQAMICITKATQQSASVLLHCDLHETRSLDLLEFRPAKFMRDGEDPTAQVLDPIPDGFFLVGDYRNHIEQENANSSCSSSSLALHRAVLAAVKKITHIAPPDAEGKILGFQAATAGGGGGLIYPEIEGICGTHTCARFKMTCEIFPDSPNCSAELALKAQLLAVTTALNTALLAAE